MENFSLCYVFRPEKKKHQNRKKIRIQPLCRQDGKDVALESRSGPQADYKPVKAADAPAAENAPVESISEEVTAKLEEWMGPGECGMGMDDGDALTLLAGP